MPNAPVVRHCLRSGWASSQPT